MEMYERRCMNHRRMYYRIHTYEYSIFVDNWAWTYEKPQIIRVSIIFMAGILLLLARRHKTINPNGYGRLLCGRFRFIDAMCPNHRNEYSISWESFFPRRWDFCFLFFFCIISETRMRKERKSKWTTLYSNIMPFDSVSESMKKNTHHFFSAVAVATIKTTTTTTSPKTILMRSYGQHVKYQNVYDIMQLSRWFGFQAGTSYYEWKSTRMCESKLVNPNKHSYTHSARQHK